MPPLEHMDLTDRAVLWVRVRADRQGFPLVAPQVEIAVRWEEGQIELVDPDGQKMVVDAQIASNRDIVIGSLLWLGSADDLREQFGTAGPGAGLYEVQFAIKGKDLKGRVTRYEFALKRFRDALPNIIS